METGIVYKIKNSNGDYYKGMSGGRPQFSSKGKAWNNLGALKSSIAQSEKRTWNEGRFDNCEVITLEIKEVNRVSFDDFFK